MAPQSAWIKVIGVKEGVFRVSIENVIDIESLKDTITATRQAKKLPCESGVDNIFSCDNSGVDNIIPPSTLIGDVYPKIGGFDTSPFFFSFALPGK